MGVHRQGAHEKHILRVKMDWLKPALLAALVICSSAQPLDQELGVNLEEQADMKELLTSMFIDNHRSARQLEEEEEEMSNMVADSEDDLEEDEVTGLTTTDPREIGRFNNYMDAIYRRMNAALRAKLMDPMVLNMNQKKDDDKKKSKKKNRVERSADLEEDEEEDEVDLVDFIIFLQVCRSFNPVLFLTLLFVVIFLLVHV